MAFLLNKVTEGVTKLTHHTIHEAAKVKEKILNDGQTHDEIAAFSSLWEIPEPIEYCRGCEAKFAMRKHHCRSCGGVFCDDCAPSAFPASAFEEGLIPKALNIAEGEAVRLCNGCKRGECPGRPMVEAIREVLDAQVAAAEPQGGSGRNAMERIQHKVALKVGEVLDKLGEEEGRQRLHVYQLRLYRGSFWGENGLVRKANASRPASMSGYFELLNKSSEVVAVKLVKREEKGALLFEAARPSYMSVPPGDAVYSFFPPDSPSLTLLLLYGNPHPIPSDRAGRNAVLKYRGEGELLPRLGNSVGRVGVWGRVQGRRFAPSLLDLSSNVLYCSPELQLSAKEGDREQEQGKAPRRSNNNSHSNDNSTSNSKAGSSKPTSNNNSSSRSSSSSGRRASTGTS